MCIGSDERDLLGKRPFGKEIFWGKRPFGKEIFWGKRPFGGKGDKIKRVTNGKIFPCE